MAVAVIKPTLVVSETIADGLPLKETSTTFITKKPKNPLSFLERTFFMFSLFATTLLELAASLIIVYLIFTFGKMELKIQTHSHHQPFNNRYLFHQRPRHYGKHQTNRNNDSKIVISPKEQALKDQLEIKLYPHGKFFLNETITVKPQNHLSN